MTDLEKLQPLAGTPFTKMTGTGNDFIVIDGRGRHIPKELRSLLARTVCRRRQSVGADGMMILEPGGPDNKPVESIDFIWDFYNADGSVAEMCGNGGRCAGRFAYEHGLAGKEMTFLTVAGPIKAMVNTDGPSPIVKLQMTKPFGNYHDAEIETSFGTIVVSGINTGVPHAVVMADDIEAAPVFDLGREMRNHEFFKPAGTNVNFIKPVNGELLVRTYERGVEDETLACGTGCVASAIVAGWKGIMTPPVNIKVRSGERLKIYFDKGQEVPEEVYLEGAADYVYEGVLSPDAFNWIAHK
jgi:diaminopimelate epimerase